MERKYGPEELKNEASRTISDAELIKNGAQYVMDDESKSPRLELTTEQLKMAAKEERTSFPENFNSLKGIELVDAVGDIYKEIKKTLENFVEKQPELAALFDIKEKSRSFWANLEKSIGYFDDPNFWRRKTPPDKREDEKGLVYNFYSQSTAHVLFRMLYLIDGYKFDDENTHPEYAKDCGELVAVIEKTRQLIERCGLRTPSPSESPYRLLNIYNHSDFNAKIAPNVPKLVREFPAIQSRIREFGQKDGWKTRIVDIEDVSVNDADNNEVLHIPTLLLSSRIDFDS